ncbi:GNAT family protein [Saccharomonospora xinjiangensis]|uniref:GNAT family N-acetyltransferase n=1 Tax=Saccharomonospora xinjiangensis TaxID=75294 RepID=UPI0010706190|nr:GNAT family protein [Saccharomonospora xinjiangensis]QBQ59403.1 Acetyltransferase (GNAT) family protein [Saccharomonospora xinjiangensis]
MESIELRRFERSQAGDLADFLSGEMWPYHSVPRLTVGCVLRQVADSYYDNSSTRTLWVTAGERRVGVVRLFDLDDDTPLFDLRITENDRHRGIGTRALRALTAYLFTELPAITRVEATTRHDNVAMRRALRRCGYVKEAHHRNAWPCDAGTPLDAVGYAILRGDWAGGTVTAVDFDDEDGFNAAFAASAGSAGN